MTYHGKPRKRYVVSAYAADEIPNPRWLDAGEFDTQAEALELAHRIVRQSLLELYHASRRPDAEGLFEAYLAFGECPAIFGSPAVRFNAFEAARWHARAIARDPRPQERVDV
jgi:hypothetical protein